MPRPRCLRRVEGIPRCNFFKPSGIPTRDLEIVLLTLDELEALRLADHQGLYQEEAAKKMNISRPTFARLVESARKKTALALVEGKALSVEGGPVEPRFLKMGFGNKCYQARGKSFGRGRNRGRNFRNK